MTRREITTIRPLDTIDPARPQPPADRPGTGIGRADIDWARIRWADIDWARIRWADIDFWERAVRDEFVRRHDSADQGNGIGATCRPAAPGRLLTMHAISEDVPGPRWAQLYEATRSAYHSWYLAAGHGQRPSLAEARDRLEEHMPELVPVWERLVELAGHEEVSARLLTMWDMPPFISGCSQAVLPGTEPVLVRNYDYDPALFEGVVSSTNYSGTRQVTGTSDLLWGLLDGMNEDGLTVSLAYGGRPGAGHGFGIPLVLRYLLETCSTVRDAIRTLRRLPVAQAYNLTLADTSGDHASVFVAPAEAPDVSSLAAVTNHRLDTVEHPHAAGRVRSRERQEVLETALRRGSSADDLVASLLVPPLRSDEYAVGFGTLYTVLYEPAAGRVTYSWPDSTWQPQLTQSDGTHTARLAPC